MVKLNEFKYSNTNKRYHTLDYFFKNKYNSKVGRVPIDGGFTCPNIDGTKSTGGCTYCSVRGSGDFIINHKEELLQQWDEGIKIMRTKWPEAKYVAYFQAFSNTYAPVSELKKKYEVFQKKTDCLAIYIGTRADCINEEIVNYLKELNEKKEVVVELGLQSIHQKSLDEFNQKETREDFEKAMSLLNKAKIEVVIHIINGLPGETKDEMIETIKYVSKLNIHGIKIHMLHIMKGTLLGYKYQKEPFSMLTIDEYVEITVQQIRMLKEEVVIHRVTGDAPIKLLLAPNWTANKTITANAIDKLMAKNNYYQGDLYENQ